MSKDRFIAYDRMGNEVARGASMEALRDDAWTLGEFNPRILPIGDEDTRAKIPKAESDCPSDLSKEDLVELVHDLKSNRDELQGMCDHLSQESDLLKDKLSGLVIGEDDVKRYESIIGVARSYHMAGERISISEEQEAVAALSNVLNLIKNAL